ncbi:SulP family inorganic anion transporter [Bacillus sp. SL00103]
MASGVGPEYGLYTVIVAGILISLFGGSKYQIGGPTGAFVPILFGIVSQYGIEKLTHCRFYGRVYACLIRNIQTRKAHEIYSRPVIIGFTAGIAVIIFSGQIANFLIKGC